MNALPWRVAWASVIGTAHERTGIPCQDASACELLQDKAGNDVLVAVVADGAGSASDGGTGAELLCRLMVEGFAALLAGGLSPGHFRQDHVVDLISAFQHRIAQVAAERSQRPRDFATTMALAVIGSESALFAQIGDSDIVAGHDDQEYLWVFWPEAGEYASQTHFATAPDVLDHLRVEVSDRRVDEVSLFSDGLQRLALDLAEHGAHDAFFAPLFTTLRQLHDYNPSEANSALARFLASPRVSARTDDDRTLVLATRRLPLIAT